MSFEKLSEGKILDQVFDKSTLMTLYSLESSGILSSIESPISSGKESIVFRARSPKGCFFAVKVYLIKNCNYKKMLSYLQGDSRFTSVKRDTRSMVFAFCAKEHRNLQRARELGVRCPRPIAYKNNVLIEEFLGDKEGKPAPRMKDIPPDDPKIFYQSISEDIKKMWKGKLVHGDLSEYNVLVFEDAPWIIDMSQSVLSSHPEALHFLKRDIYNINKYFMKKGVETSDLFEELVKKP